MQAEDEFYEIIAELIDYYQRHNEMSRKKISEILGLSDSYVRQIHSRGSGKRYQLSHLFILSRKWNISIDNLVPSEETIKNIERYRFLDLKSRLEVIERLEESIIYKEEDYE